MGKEGSKGKFPVSIEIKKKDGKIKQYMLNAGYKIKGNRIAMDAGYDRGYVGLSIAYGFKKKMDFKKVFGENPDIECYAESVDVDILGNSYSTSEVVSSSNKTSGSGNKLLQSIKEQLDRIEKKLKFIGIE